MPISYLLLLRVPTSDQCHALTFAVPMLVIAYIANTSRPEVPKCRTQGEVACEPAIMA